MDDDELLRRFEDCTLDTFPHANHVRVAFLLLRDAPLTEALTRFSTGLSRFAAAKGAGDKFHATITWAFMLLIHERLERGGPTRWPAFIATHPELLDRAILGRYYRAETLASPLARRTFILPDQPPHGVAAAPAHLQGT